MPMQLLTELCAAQLPFQLVDDEDIEKLAVLRAAGFVQADIPPVVQDEAGWRFLGCAVVLHIADAGFAAANTRRGYVSSARVQTESLFRDFQDPGLNVTAGRPGALANALAVQAYLQLRTPARP